MDMIDLIKRLGANLYPWQEELLRKCFEEKDIKKIILYQSPNRRRRNSE